MTVGLNFILLMLATFSWGFLIYLSRLANIKYQEGSDEDNGYKQFVWVLVGLGCLLFGIVLLAVSVTAITGDLKLCLS